MLMTGKEDCKLICLLSILSTPGKMTLWNILREVLYIIWEKQLLLFRGLQTSTELWYQFFFGYGNF